jgi:hypothetical protein
MDIQKTENKLPATLLPLSKSELCVMLSSNNLAGVANILPSTLKNALGQPPICDLERVVGRTQIVRYIEFELVKMSSLISVGGNLNDAQVQFIATQMVEMFPNESLADFKLCFQRGCIGQYGEIYRMDGIVLRQWMEKYLEEKYSIVEDVWAKQKEAEKKPIQSETENDWLKVWKEAVDKLPHQHRFDLTDEEIRKEGQSRPTPIEYKPSVVAQAESVASHREKVNQARRKYFLAAKPDATEEQIEAYIRKMDQFSDL